MDHVTDKILYMRDFFSRSLCGCFDIFGNTYMVDLKTILLDISNQSKRFLSNFQTKNYKILKSLKNELDDYISDCTYYMQNDNIRNNLDELIQKLNLIINVQIPNNWSKDKQIHYYVTQLDQISFNLISLLVGNKYFYDILKYVINLCLDSKTSLAIVKDTIQAMCRDAIFAAYNANLSTEFLQDSLEKIDKIIRSESFSNLDEWKELIEPLPIQDIEYFFLIPNLNLMIPFKYNDILFYNPFRLDLLKHYYNTDFTKYDYFLFTIKEQTFFTAKFPDYDPRDESKCPIPLEKVFYTENEHDEIIQSDCHARLVIKAETGKSGVDLARNKINNTLRALNNFGLLYQYKEKELRNYIYKETVIHNTLMQPFTDDRTFDKSPYGIREGSQRLKDAIESKESDIHKVVEYNNNYLVNLNFWFHRACNAEDIIDKYIYLMICLEGIVALNRRSSITNDIVDLAKGELVTYLFEEALSDIGKDVHNQLIRLHPLPNEIQAIVGKEVWDGKMNISDFQNNLSLFIKYVHSPVLKTYAVCLLELKKCDYNDFFIKLEKRLEYTFHRIYNYRSLIIHGNEHDQNFAKQNVRILNILVSHLLGHVLSETKLQKMSNEDYDKWKDQIVHSIN